MYNKVSTKTITIMTIFIAAILTAPSSVLQFSHAQTFADTILEIHNNERAAVGVPSLVWSDELAADAQNWANQLPPLRHAQGINQGENLWGGTAGAFTTDRQVQTWVNEKNNYDGSPIGETQGTGHYTQMVWQTTTQVGCATATSGDMDFLVCRYSPAGNILGQMPYPPANQPAAPPTGQPAPTPTPTPTPAPAPAAAPPANQTTPAPAPAAAPPANQTIPAPAPAAAPPANQTIPAPAPEAPQEIPIVRPERALPEEQPAAAPPANQTIPAPAPEAPQEIPIVRPERALPEEQPAAAAPPEQPAAAAPPPEQPAAAAPPPEQPAAAPDEEYGDFFAIFFSFSDEEYGGDGGDLNGDLNGGDLYDLFNRILGR